MSLPLAAHHGSQPTGAQGDPSLSAMLNSHDDWASIDAMLAFNAARFGTLPAILGEGGLALSHRELHAQVTLTARALGAAGIGRGDRVAIALPPGPDSAVAFLAAASCATAAPLNPAYGTGEFDSQLRGLPARLLLLLRDDDSAARAAAQALGIPVMPLVALRHRHGSAGTTDGTDTAMSPGMAASTDITASAERAPGSWGRAAGDDVALVLHTSGTTSRPKKVPLSHANLCASARNIAATLQLQVDDISLNAMPLFHIHGLACLLAALAAGGSCVCPGAFDAARFRGWLQRWQPTWFSTVPTVLQALVDLSAQCAVAAPSLRFVRSSSAPLSPALLAKVEQAFGVPVIESYGMTEAAHQMASNPLPPCTRKPGSVGIATGTQLAILDQAGVAAGSGATGEVVVKGANVMRGYEDTPDANAFCDGWFRTGDQGYVDQDGYVFITGRLKELINRGGEKIAPREIDEALLAHPAVRQAVAFALPHPSLGEDIAAAVVLHAVADAQPCSEAALRAFLFDRLSAYKVPSRIILVDSLPVGPSGKIQRIGLADRLAAWLHIAYDAPVSEREQLVAATIGEQLGLVRVGRQDNFFTLGGDSLRAAQVMMRLEHTLAIELPAALLFRLPTPALLAPRLEELLAAREIDLLAAQLAALPAQQRAMLIDDAQSSDPEPGPGATVR
jgi:acyl-CoA synthetase (AMP-forming)/AMP-acid ligase II/acyl carrier protein